MARAAPPGSGRRQVPRRLADVRDDVGGRHGHFAEFSGGEVAGRAVQVHAEQARRVTPMPCASHPATIPVSTSPEPPVAMPGLPVGLM